MREGIDSGLSTFVGMSREWVQQANIESDIDPLSGKANSVGVQL
jgi:hypothetical protein